MVGSTRSRPRFLAERRSSSEGPVARIERSEIRECREHGKAVPGFAGAQPGLRQRPPYPPLQAGEGIERRATRNRGLIAARAVVIVATMGGISSANADAALRPYTVVGDAIPASLTGAPADPGRGKAIVASRQTGVCLLCPSPPAPR